MFYIWCIILSMIRLYNGLGEQFVLCQQCRVLCQYKTLKYTHLHCGVVSQIVSSENIYSTTFVPVLKLNTAQCVFIEILFSLYRYTAFLKYNKRLLCSPAVKSMVMSIFWQTKLLLLFFLYQLYLRSIAKQVITTYNNLSQPLIPDRICLIFLNELLEEREARHILICWALKARMHQVPFL